MVRGPANGNPEDNGNSENSPTPSKTSEDVPNEIKNFSEAVKRLDNVKKQLNHDISKRLRASASQVKQNASSEVAQAGPCPLETALKQALSLYDDEMEKFMKGRGQTGLREVRAQHKKAAEMAISLFQDSDAVDDTTSLDDIREQLVKRKVKYDDILLMNRAAKTNPAIGIDLGTTMCCVAVFDRGEVHIIKNQRQRGSKTTPSFVSYHEDGTETFGSVAKEEAYRYTDTTIYDAKRIIGRPWTDVKLQRYIKENTWPFTLVNDMGSPKIQTFGRSRYPHEISAKLLAYFKQIAGEYLNLPVRKAVITVPAYFTEPQRNATREAALCAGLDVLNILSEPTAAAIAYHWKRREDEKRLVLVYDLGGGTFDVSIAEVTKDEVKVLVVNGNTDLGGQDFDMVLVDHCVAKFRKKEGIDLRHGLSSTNQVKKEKARSILSRIKLQCEIAKETLSSTDVTSIQVPYVLQDKDLIVPITKQKLNKLITPFIQSTLDIVQNALTDAAANGVEGKQSIDDVMLVGGSTRIPLVFDMITEFFNGKEPCRYTDPDEDVAYGAALNAAILNKNGNLPSLKIQDVTPLSLGIELANKDFAMVIPRNSKIPCEHSDIFRTYSDNQTHVTIWVYQGEAGRASKNKLLGKFKLNGIPPKPAGTEKVKVTMSINEMGLLSVEAVSLTTEKRNGITITSERLGMDKGTMDRVLTENQMMSD